MQSLSNSYYTIQSPDGFHWVKKKVVCKAALPLEALGENPFLFQVIQGCLLPHSWLLPPPSTPAALPLSFLLLSFAYKGPWTCLHNPEESPNLETSNLITFPESPLLCKITYLQLSGVRTKTSSGGGGHYSTYRSRSFSQQCWHHREAC